MQTVRTRQELKEALRGYRASGKRIGLVPTMGALHAGHASLVERAVRECDIVVVSDFVNPTQFNNPRDLETYPRCEAEDAALLKQCGASILFAPSVEEMYPVPDTSTFSFPPLDTVMEGARRPGHFNGVCQIVSKLLLLVEPAKAYFGRKDYQQLLVVRTLARSIGSQAEIVGCPIIRESDGLAMSSRNMLLTPAHRAEAPAIHRALAHSASTLFEKGLDGTRQWLKEQIEGNGILQLEYFTLSHAESLQEVVNVETNDEGHWVTLKTGEGIETETIPYTPGGLMGFVAVQAGEVRLIDNQQF